jgi:hypothetical protein
MRGNAMERREEATVGMEGGATAGMEGGGIDGNAGGV